MNLLDDDNKDQTDIDPNKDYLAELVGEGKKFKTSQDLARSKYESDTYIKTLTGRLDEMRTDYERLNADYTARAKLEELLDKMANKTHETPQNVNTDTPKPGIELKDVESLLSNKLKEHESVKQQEANVALIENKLKETWGQGYQAKLKQSIEDLGIDKQTLNDLARTQPKLLIRTLGLDRPQQQEEFHQLPRSSQRSDPFAPKTQKRTWSYYQELRKTDPKLYYDPKIAVQMQRDAIDLGEAFKDGDYKAL